MARHRSNRQFGGPNFGDWALLGVSGAMTGYSATRIVKKTRIARERRREYEEEYDPRDVVNDYDRGYYLRDSY